jgi:hypothetical protein
MTRYLLGSKIPFLNTVRAEVRAAGHHALPIYVFHPAAKYRSG